MIVNFTCIYVPKIDTEIYGYKDASDILELKQQDETFTIEIYLPKNEVTELKIRTMVTFANYLHMSFYMSVADYKRFKRNTDNLYGVSSIVLDLDTYNTKYQDFTFRIEAKRDGVTILFGKISFGLSPRTNSS